MHSMLGFWLTTWNLQRRGSFPPGVAIALAVLAVAGVIYLYVKEAGRLNLATRLMMASVRMAIVLLVAFLFVRPVLVSDTRDERSRPICILIDASESMGSKDPRPNSADRGRVAVATGKVDADKGLPHESLLSSLQLPDRPKRIEVARDALENKKLDLFRRLSHVGPLDVYTFGSHRTGRDSHNTEWLKTLEANEPSTKIVESALEVLNRTDADVPAALVLVTDGRENGGGRSLDDLASECARRKVPVYVYGVGSSSYGQLRVKDATVPETMFVDDLVAVPVRYTVKGVKEGRAEIILSYGGREVARKDLAVREGDDLRETLTFTPTKEDSGARVKQELTATINIFPTGGVETETLTDAVTRPSQVIDKKLKVLVVDSQPRFDFKFLQRALLRDRRVEARFYLTEGDKAAMRSGPPWMVEFSRELNGTLNLDREEFRKILFEFDLLILGAVPARFFSTEQQNVIREFVTEGGGMIHIAGRSYGDQPDKWTGPAAWAGAWETRQDKGETRYVSTRPPSPIGELLPVEYEAVRMPIVDPRPASPFVPVLAPGASRSSIVTLEDDPLDNADLWGKHGNNAGLQSERQLKPLYWYYPVLKTKPAADVFLVHPTDFTPYPDHKPMPLMVGHFFGKGYVLYVGFDDTWRWRFNSAEKLFGRFWSQAIYTAGLPRTVGTRLTQLSLDVLDPVRGGTGQVYARVFNENFKLLTADELDATLERLDADPNDPDRSAAVKMHKLSGQDGEYIAAIPFNKEGRFRLTVDPKNKTPASLEYRVSLPSTDEKSLGGMDEEALRKLCEASGGKFYREEDLHHLPNDVKAQTIVVNARHEWLFWNGWILGGLIAALSIEWLLRKFNGLS